MEDSKVSDSASKVSESASGTGLMSHEAKDLEHQSTALLVSLKDADRESKLNSMGLLTGLAIAIHNFPEGLATFVAAVEILKSYRPLLIFNVVLNVKRLSSRSN